MRKWIDRVAKLVSDLEVDNPRYQILGNARSLLAEMQAEAAVEISAEPEQTSIVVSTPVEEVPVEEAPVDGEDEEKKPVRAKRAASKPE